MKPEYIPRHEVVICERNYKGNYERFALTLPEFYVKYGASYPDMPVPNERLGANYTLKPMVHLWYQTTRIGSKLWNRFFTDMSWALPESDIEAGNLAYVRLDLMYESMIPFVREIHLPPAKPDLRRVYALVAKLDTRHGVSIDVSLHASHTEAVDHRNEAAKQLDYDEETASDDEVFDWNVIAQPLDIRSLEKWTEV